MKRPVSPNIRHSHTPELAVSETTTPLLIKVVIDHRPQPMTIFVLPELDLAAGPVVTVLCVADPRAVLREAHVLARAFPYPVGEDGGAGTIAVVVGPEPDTGPVARIEHGGGGIGSGWCCR